MRHIDPDIGVSRKRLSQGYRFETKDYDKFQLILVQSGILNVKVHERDISLERGGLVILRLGSVFELSSKAGYCGLGIIVEKPELPALIGESRFLQANGQLLATAELIEHFLMMPDIESRRTIRGLALALIWQAVRLEKKHLSKHREKWPEIAKGILDANLGTGIPAREALEHLPLCYRQLSRLFMDTYGMSPKQYQVAARITEAKRMLAAPGTNVTDTAMELGFSSSQHFATQFKEMTGMTPREFAAGT